MKEHCDLCGSDLRVKYSRKNQQIFLSCSKYPECKGSANLSEQDMWTVVDKLNEGKKTKEE